SKYLHDNKIVPDTCVHAHVNAVEKPFAGLPGRADAAIHSELALHQYSNHVITDQKYVPDCGHTRYEFRHALAAADSLSDVCDPRCHALSRLSDAGPAAQYNSSRPILACP